MEHTTKEKMYICLLLNRLFVNLVPENAPNRTEIAMDWLFAIRQVDGIMLSVSGGSSEPFCVSATRNNLECFDDDIKKRAEKAHSVGK
jgi:hypothetical protein